MRRVYEEHPRYRDHAMLAESSDCRRYDEAIATVRALRDLLSAAAFIYDRAHPASSSQPPWATARPCKSTVA